MTTSVTCGWCGSIRPEPDDICCHTYGEEYHWLLACRLAGLDRAAPDEPVVADCPRA